MTTPPPDTPHAPGFWPSTPDEASSAYHQNEGPLESAGRSLPPASTLGPVLLGAGAGLLVGGPLGALAGGTLGGLGSLEHAGLKSKAQSASNNTAAFEQQQVKQDHALAESPAQKILASTSSTETAGTTAASTLLAGGAGVVTDEAVEHEVAEPAVEPLQPLETSSGLAAEPAADDTVLNMVRVAATLSLRCTFRASFPSLSLIAASHCTRRLPSRPLVHRWRRRMMLKEDFRRLRRLYSVLELVE